MQLLSLTARYEAKAVMHREKPEDLTSMQPMNTFDPSNSCKVHDGLNDCLFDWKPEWALNYRTYAEKHNQDDPNVIAWDGLLLDGWMRGQPVPTGLHPMSTFNPSQPAILHDRKRDQIVTWTGEYAEAYRASSRVHEDDSVEWGGHVFDGWRNMLVG
jgi:hypothetical protein